VQRIIFDPFLAFSNIAIAQTTAGPNAVCPCYSIFDNF